MLNWGVELGEFDIKFVQRTALKGQSLVDFVVECSIPTPPEDAENGPSRKDDRVWIIHIDESSNGQGSGAGVVMQSPDDHTFKHAIRFMFKTSNNMAEYEAALAGLELARAVKASKVSIKSDSQLVVGQCTEEFEARDETMKKYQAAVRSRMTDFDEVTFQQIPRSENEKADVLAKLASSPTTEMDPTIHLEYLQTPTVKKEHIMEIHQAPCWMDPIIAFLEKGTLTDDIIEA